MMIFIGLTQIWAAQNLIYEEKKSVKIKISLDIEKSVSICANLWKIKHLWTEKKKNLWIKVICGKKKEK